MPLIRSELRDAYLVIFALCAKWQSVLSTSARIIHVAKNAPDCKQTLSVPCARLMRNFRRSYRRSDVKSNVATPQYGKRVKSVDLVLWIPPDTNAVVADAFVDTYSSRQRSLKITKLAIIHSLVPTAARTPGNILRRIAFWHWLEFREVTQNSSVANASVFCMRRIISSIPADGQKNFLYRTMVALLVNQSIRRRMVALS